MATLLFWLSWRSDQPDSKSWSRLLERAGERSRFAGIERSGPGFRLYAARSREAEPAVLLEQRAADGGEELLLLDRAPGADDAADRNQDQWPAARLMDGAPTAAVRWNSSARTLVLYRDVMGQRGLVYARIRGGLLVASGEHMLRAHPEVSGELDAAYLATYFAALPPAQDETVFKNIRSLGAGEILEFDNDGGVRSTIATLQPDSSWRGLRDEAVIERFRALFEASVRSACRGARRVGISLSAGLDSSSVAAAASRLPPAPNGPVIAVTHALADFPDIDESAMVAELARELGIEHRAVRVDDLAPFSDAALRPICPDSPQQWPYREWYERGYQELAKAGADVCLSGAFGDHLFAGAVEWVVDALRFRRFGLLARQLAGERGRQGWRGMLHDTALRRPASRLLGRVGLVSDRVRWLDPPFQKTVYERLHAEAARYRGFPHPLQCVMHLNASAGCEASREQWYAQRHALEYRMPFRDLALTRFCLSLPADFSYRDGQRKWLLRQAMRGWLPDALRLRRKGSSLTPVYQRAIERQAPVLQALREQAGQPPAAYFSRLAQLRVDADAWEAVRWLQASFGAWTKATTMASP